MSAETWASVRPTRGIPPACSTVATRSAAAPAARSAASSAASLTARIGDVTVEAATQVASGSRAWRARTDVAQARSETANAPTGRRSRLAGGRPRCRQGPRRRTKAAGRTGPRPSATRGASRAGDHQHRVAGQREDQHGQPLERHGPVAGEPGQIGPVGQEQGVDAELVHPLAHTGHALRPAGAGPRRQLGHEPGDSLRGRHRRRGPGRRPSGPTTGDGGVGRLSGVVARTGQRARPARGRIRGPSRRSRSASNSSGRPPAGHRQVARRWAGGTGRGSRCRRRRPAGRPGWPAPRPRARPCPG